MKNAIKRTAFCLALLLLTGAGARAALASDTAPVIALRLPDGAVAEAVPCTDDETAYWALLPDGVPTEGLTLVISGGSAADYSPRSGDVISAPDAGDGTDSGAAVEIDCLSETGEITGSLSLYVSHMPYSPEITPRNIRSVGRYARLTRGTALLGQPGKSSPSVYRLASDVRLLVLYTCRMDGVGYACVLFNGQALYVAESRVTMLTDETGLAFDAQIFGDGDSTPDVRFAVTGYPAALHSNLRSSEASVIERAPKDTLLLVMRTLRLSGRQWDLVYRPDTGSVGFVHDTQLLAPDTETLSSLLRSGGASAALPGSGVVAQDDADMKAFPAKDAETLTRLPGGTKLTLYADIDTPDGAYVLARSEKWMGYLPAALVDRAEGTDSPALTDAAPAVAEDAQYGSGLTVAVNEALAFKEPSVSAAVVMRLKRGDSLTLCARDSQPQDSRWTAAEGPDGAVYIPSAWVTRLRVWSHTEEKPLD